jgi:hypothetical protein
MRIYGNPEYAKRNLERGKEAARLKASQFSPPLRRPDAGTLLRTVVVTDHLTGNTYELQICQADRKNGIVVSRLGKPIEVCGSYDGLFRFLRKQWALRWLTA